MNEGMDKNVLYRHYIGTHTQTQPHNSIGMGDFHFSSILVANGSYVELRTLYIVLHTHTYIAKQIARDEGKWTYERMDVFINNYYIFNSIA